MVLPRKRLFPRAIATPTMASAFHSSNASCNVGARARASFPAACLFSISRFQLTASSTVAAVYVWRLPRGPAWTWYLHNLPPRHLAFLSVYVGHFLECLRTTPVGSPRRLLSVMRPTPSASAQARPVRTAV